MKSLLLALLLSCQPDTPDKTDSSADSTGTPDSHGTDSNPVDSPVDTAPPSDCLQPGDPSEIFGGVLANQNPSVATVFTVVWDPQKDGDSYVMFGADGTEPVRVPSYETPSGGLEATLLGMKASSSYSYQIFLQSGEDLFCTAPSTVTTGTLDPALPMLTLETNEPSLSAGGYTVLPIQTSSGWWAVILDADGDYVYYQRADPLRAWVSLDRRAMLVNDHTFDPESEGHVYRVPFNGSETVDAAALGAHTDFVEVEPGVYATFGWDLREYEGGSRVIAGETIFEFQADGTRTEVWNVFDDFEPDLGQTYNKDLPCCPDAEVWVHMNHLSYNAEEDAYYATSRNMSTVFRIERATGALSWVLGGANGDFTAPEGEYVVFGPHSAVRTSEGILVFDTSSINTSGCSGMQYFALDTETMVADPSWVYTTEDCLVNGYLGNATELENGNRMMVLAMNAQIDEVTPEGSLAWRITGPLETLFAYGIRLPGLYP